MKADPLHRDAEGPDQAHTSAPGKDHGHGHGHAHSHDHAHGPAHRHAQSHKHAGHAHGAAPPRPTPSGDSRPSLLMSSAPLRLAGAIALAALLWAAVAWALSGTP